MFDFLQRGRTAASETCFPERQREARGGTKVFQNLVGISTVDRRVELDSVLTSVAEGVRGQATVDRAGPSRRQDSVQVPLTADGTNVAQNGALQGIQ